MLPATRRFGAIGAVRGRIVSERSVTAPQAEPEVGRRGGEGRSEGHLMPPAFRAPRILALCLELRHLRHELGLGFFEILAL